MYQKGIQMQHIKQWGEIYEIYKKTNRNHILKSNGHAKLFYACIAIYFIVAIAASFFKDTYFFTSILSIFFVAMAISIVFIYTLSKDYAEELKGHPLFAKSKYIKFIEFKKHFELSPNLSPEAIPALLEWEEIRNQRFDTINFFTNPITLIVLSAFLSQVFTSFSSTGKSVEILVVGAYMFMAVMFISWTAYDFLSSNKKKNFEICRLLRWVQIENKSPAS
jgi:MFS family permease